LVEVTDAQIAQYETLQQQAHADGRSVRVRYSAGSLSLPADDRFYCQITIDAAHWDGGRPNVGEVIANGTDAAIITFTVLQADGTPDPLFSGTRRVSLFDRVVILSFVAGVATKNYKATRSVVLEARSTPQIRLKAPFRLVAAVSGDMEN
jgi:hypothetical protein